MWNTWDSDESSSSQDSATLASKELLAKFQKAEEDDKKIEALPEAKKLLLKSAADAIIAGDVNALKNILDNNADDPPGLWTRGVEAKEGEDGWNNDHKCSKKWTLLHYAVAKDQLECIKFLIDNVPALATALAQKMETALLFAISLEKDLELIKTLIQGEGKQAINCEKTLFTTPLWQAFQVKSSASYALNLVKLLIANGAKYTKCLRGPIIGGHVEVVEYMMSLGGDPKATFEKSYYKEFPLHLAASNGFADIVRLLLKHAPETVNKKTKDGETPIMVAASHGHEECIELLIAAGAKPIAQNRDGAAALLLAAQSGKHQALKALMKQKSVQAMAKKMENYRTELHPLFGAIDSGSLETVKVLVNSDFCRYDLVSPDNEIEMNADMEDESYCFDWNCLDMISYVLNENSKEKEEIAHFLIDEGFPLTEGDGPGPLAVAIMQMPGDEEGMERVIRHLLEAGANFEYAYESRGLFGNKKKKRVAAPQALVVAISAKSEKALRLLLQYWWREPAQLLVLYDEYRPTEMNPLKIDQWFPVLAGYGLPHGDPMMQVLEGKLKRELEKVSGPPPKKRKGSKNSQCTQDPDVVAKKQLFTSFLEQLKNPSSLKQLARFATRKILWKKAGWYQDTLPTYLKQKVVGLEPELMSYLVMEKP